MPLHRLSEEEQRSYARKAIESLESAWESAWGQSAWGQTLIIVFSFL